MIFFDITLVYSKYVRIFEENIKTKDMKKQERITKVQFSGSGHYNVSIVRYGKEYSATITDMQTIDEYKDGKISAFIRLYNIVSRKNDLS